jgi:hypothetical protein
MEDGQCEREDQGDDRVEERVQAGFDQAGSCQDCEQPTLLLWYTYTSAKRSSLLIAVYRVVGSRDGQDVSTPTRIH